VEIDLKVKREEAFLNFINVNEKKDPEPPQKVGKGNLAVC
jgi:hypothetical protein